MMKSFDYDGDSYTSVGISSLSGVGKGRKGLGWDRSP